MMLGLFVVFLVSWVLLKLISGESILALGITPTRRRLLECGLAMAFMAGVAVINFLWQADFKQIDYALNPEYSPMAFLGGVFWIVRAVLFEELVFRGALLLLLMRYLGAVKACLFSAITFGIYHWFSYGVLGERWILMAYIFLVTGAGGWMFAYAFAKTGSLYAPTGLHLGWNLVTALVFSAGPIGNHLLIQQGEAAQTSEWVTLIFFSLQAIVAPGLVTWYLARRYPPPVTPA